MNEELEVEFLSEVPPVGKRRIRLKSSPAIVIAGVAAGVAVVSVAVLLYASWWDQWGMALLALAILVLPVLFIRSQARQRRLLETGTPLLATVTEVEDRGDGLFVSHFEFMDPSGHFHKGKVRTVQGGSQVIAELFHHRPGTLLLVFCDPCNPKNHLWLPNSNYTLLKNPQFPAPRWIGPNDNRFGIEMLDCRPMALQLGFMAGPEAVREFNELRASSGEHLRRARPLEANLFPCSLTYPIKAHPKDGPLFKAEKMEDRWDIYLYDGYLCFCDSCTGWPIFRARIEFREHTAHIDKIEIGERTDGLVTFSTFRENGRYEPDNFVVQYVVRQVDFLMKSHVYGLEVPHPLPPELNRLFSAKDIHIWALHSFNLYGRRGLYGTFSDTLDLPFGLEAGTKSPQAEKQAPRFSTPLSCIGRSPAAVKEAEKFGEHDPRLAISLNNLADLYHAQGRYAEAEPLVRRALAIREKTLGPEHPDVAVSLNNLAELYRAQGQYAEAEPLFRRAFAIWEKTLGPEHPNVAASLNNLALLCRNQGRYAEAEPLFRRALATDEKALGLEHSVVAMDLSNLAELYCAQRKYAEAEPLFRRALAIDEKALGLEHSLVASDLNNLAELYRAQGQYAQAESFHRRALAIREKTLGPEHPHVAISLNNLADLYRAQGQHAEAEPLQRRALAISEKTLGPEHPTVAISLDNLAGLCCAQGRYAEAEPLNRRALAILEKALGPEHPDVATSLNNLGELYRAQGQYAEAERVHRRTLAIREKTLGPAHPHVAISLGNLAGLYCAQGQYNEAEPLCRRALAIREKTLGPEHPHVATSLNDMAELCRAQGQYAEAERLFRRALAILEKTLGPEHPDVATSLNNLAELYRAQGQYAEAEPLQQRALAIREKALGPKRPDVVH